MPTPERRAARRQNAETRTQCYQELRACAKRELAEHYAKHPEWFLDDRSKQGIERSLAMLSCMFAILDGYDIGPLRGPDGKPLVKPAKET